jgi:acetyltransferase
MTTRNLSALFRPAAIALIGASNQPGSVGAVIATNLVAGGFPGRLFMVNPHAREVAGLPCWPSIAALPEPIDLAVIATPPATLPAIISDLAARGARAAIVITAGLDAGIRQQMLEAARPHLLRILGPNCLGFLSPGAGINASFAQAAPLRGRLALLSQSGAIATSLIDWANGHGVGFSHILSLGDMNDIDFGDALDFLSADPDTSAILLYAETITQARKFMSASRIAARAKPVIVVKAGRSASGAKAAASHTGALAGADAVYDAAFRRAGILRVNSLRELFSAAEALASGVRVRQQNLVILTNGGGLGVLAADSLERNGGQLLDLSRTATEALDKVLPASWSHGNPLDILGDAHGERYAAALDVLTRDHRDTAILAMNCPTGVADSKAAAAAVIAAAKRHPGAPLLGCWIGEATAAAARTLLSQAGIPAYETPDEAVQAFLQLADYARGQEALLQAPAAGASGAQRDRPAAAKIVAAVLAENRAVLTEPEGKAVLAAYGVPVVDTRFAASPREAGQAAAGIGDPVALKILSRQITHKSDVGGVRLDLEGAAAVEAAAGEMLKRVAARAPGAVIDGFTVQSMIRRPLAQELLLGIASDPTFGPCLLFGQGGIATEIIADRTIGLPPLNDTLARDMISRTRVSRLLAGYRGRPPADLAAVSGVLCALSDLVIDIPEIAELDINPLLADGDGVIALDARIVVRPVASGAAQARFAIRPYPSEISRTVDVGGRRLTLRAIRPDDAVRLTDMASRTSRSDLRFRFHGSIQNFAKAAARLSQIDYDRELAIVAEESDGAVCVVVRLVFDPNFAAAECALIVRSDAQDQGLGRLLLREAIAYAGTRGARSVHGDIMQENARMLDMAREMGAALTPAVDDAGTIRANFSTDADR